MPQFLRFVDNAGRRWRVYEFSVIAGRILYSKLDWRDDPTHPMNRAK